MATTEPIRDPEDLERLKNHYLTKEKNVRNYTLIIIGLNTALRISDLLSITWNHVYDFQAEQFRTHLDLTEQKTNKKTHIILNETALRTLQAYKEAFPELHPGDYLFVGKSKTKPLSRHQAYRIINRACDKEHIKGTIGCHSLRKTFGYHAWKAGILPVLIMAIYNHSSFEVTKHYLGIEQDDKDAVYQAIQL
jgi:integrase